jgi:hypothetical protein
MNSSSKKRREYFMEQQKSCFQYKIPFLYLFLVQRILKRGAQKNILNLWLDRKEKKQRTN